MLKRIKALKLRIKMNIEYLRMAKRINKENLKLKYSVEEIFNKEKEYMNIKSEIDFRHGFFDVMTLKENNLQGITALDNDKIVVGLAYSDHNIYTLDSKINFIVTLTHELKHVKEHEDGIINLADDNMNSSTEEDVIKYLNLDYEKRAILYSLEQADRIMDTYFESKYYYIKK